MNPKTQFGIDFLYLSRILANLGLPQSYLHILDITALHFLTLWDFDDNEIQIIKSEFNEILRVNPTIDEQVFKNTVNRMILHFKNKTKDFQLKFLKQLVALSYTDYQITLQQRDFLEGMSGEFDLRSSEFNELEKQGIEITKSLSNFANIYARESIKIEGQRYLNFLLGE